MRVLALDISRKATGWAADGDGGRPRTGAWHLRHGADMPGKAGVELSGLMTVEIQRFRPEFFAVEAPAYGSRTSGKDQRGGFVMDQATSLLLIGLVFMALSVAAAHDIPSEQTHVATWRKHFLGAGYPEDPKPLARRRCAMLGWIAESGDAAEAAGIWCYTKAKHDRSFRIETGTPLFAAGAAR